jgi:hypothetical protein
MDKPINLLIVTLFCGAWLGAATRTAVKSGNASDPAVWGASLANGDNINVGNFSVAQDIPGLILGTSGAPALGYVSTWTGGGGAGYTSCGFTLNGGTATRAATVYCAVTGGAISLQIQDRGIYSVCPTSGTITPSGPGTGAVTNVMVTCIAGGGTAAVQVGNGGTITFAADTELRGDIGFTASFGGGADVVRISPGVTVNFNESLAAAGTYYRLMLTSGNFNNRYARLDCSGGATCAWKATGGITTFDQGGAGGADSAFRMIANNVYFQNVGDATTRFATSIGGDTSVAQSDNEFLNNTFDSCGVLSLNAAQDMIAKVNGNRFINPPAGLPGHIAFNNSSNTALGTGARELKNNSFAASAYVPPGGLYGTNNVKDFTITGNYFANSGEFNVNSGGVWASFTNNFWRLGELTTSTGNIAGNMGQTYLFHDVDITDNPHYWGTWVGRLTTGSLTLDGVIVGTSATCCATDSGEWLVGPNAASSVTTIQNSLQLCNPQGYGVAELISTQGTPASASWVLQHNTVCGGFATASGGFGAINLNETNNTAPGTITFRDNLVFNLNPGPWHKMVSYNNRTTPPADLCVSSPACDYNGSYNLEMTASWCTGCTNQAKGYISKWTAQAPGQHDVDNQNPAFLEAGTLLSHGRKVENFDRLYLGPKGLIPAGEANPDAWSAGTYGIGALVSHAAGAMYNNETLNFRCKAASCTVEPGVPGTAWRSQWEWAALYQVRALLFAQAQITDADFNCAGCYAAQALVNWTTAGYAPTNAAFKGAAHDGGDIGAVAAMVTNSATSLVPIIW